GEYQDARRTRRDSALADRVLHELRGRRQQREVGDSGYLVVATPRLGRPARGAARGAANAEGATVRHTGQHCWCAVRHPRRRVSVGRYSRQHGRGSDSGDSADDRRDRGVAAGVRNHPDSHRAAAVSLRIPAGAVVVRPGRWWFPPAVFSAGRDRSSTGTTDGSGGPAGPGAPATDAVRQPTGAVLHDAVPAVAGWLPGTQQRPVAPCRTCSWCGGVFHSNGPALVGSYGYEPAYHTCAAGAAEPEVRPYGRARAAEAGTSAAGCGARSAAGHVRGDRGRVRTRQRYRE